MEAVQAAEKLRLNWLITNWRRTFYWEKMCLVFFQLVIWEKSVFLLSFRHMMDKLFESGL